MYTNKSFDICPCCHNDKHNTNWHFNFKEGIKVCNECYSAMRISERDFLMMTNQKPMIFLKCLTI